MKRSTRVLGGLAALFFGPFLIAVLLYLMRGPIGGFATLENPDREFIEPPPGVPLAGLELADGSRSEPDWARSRWTLIYGRMNACEAACEASLTRLHQVYLALGGERDRVQLVFLAPAAAVPAALPVDFLNGRLADTRSAALIRALGPERLEEGRYFVVDPLGNVILSYPDSADQGRLLEDLERLLDVSRVG